MKLSESQIESISKTIREMNNGIDKLTVGIDLAIARISELNKQGLAIEMMLIFAQVVEHRVRQVLEAIKTKRRVEHTLGVNEKNYDLSDLKDDLTLGALISLLAKEVEPDSELISLLRSFNREYRVRLVHKIFDGSESDLKSINETALIYMATKSLELAAGLKEVQERIRLEVEALCSKHGVYGPEHPVSQGSRSGK